MTLAPLLSKSAPTSASAPRVQPFEPVDLAPAPLLDAAPAPLLDAAPAPVLDAAPDPLLDLAAAPLDAPLVPVDLAAAPSTEAAPSPPLIEVPADPDASLFAGLIFTLFAVGFGAAFLRLPWWLPVAAAVLLYFGKTLARARWDRLREPVVRLSSTTLRQDQELLVECDLRAKSDATVLLVVVGLVSVESHGESSNTESYGDWALLLDPCPVGTAPVTVRGSLRVPEPRSRQWSGSKLAWHLTLRAHVEGGLTVSRRYPVELS